MVARMGEDRGLSFQIKVASQVDWLPGHDPVHGSDVFDRATSPICRSSGSWATPQAFRLERSYTAQVYADLLHLASRSGSPHRSGSTHRSSTPDDDTRLRVYRIGPGTERSRPAVAADRPEHDNVRDIIQRLVPSGAATGRFGPDRQRKPWLSRWLRAFRMSIQVFAPGWLSRTRARTGHWGTAGRARRAGPLHLDLPGKIQPFKINITINTD